MAVEVEEGIVCPHHLFHNQQQEVGVVNRKYSETLRTTRATAVGQGEARSEWHAGSTLELNLGKIKRTSTKERCHHMTNASYMYYHFLQWNVLEVTY